jgi:CheY-like chemotaxis protein
MVLLTFRTGCYNSFTPAMTSFSEVSNALIVEDDAIDLQQATEILKGVGVSKIDSAASSPRAIRYLEEVAEQKRPAPAVIVLDLALGYDSGFEVLRCWKSDRRLKDINIVVWTQMGEREQELCRLFGLEHVVPKWKDIEELQTTLQQVLQRPIQRSAEADDVQ